MVELVTKRKREKRTKEIEYFSNGDVFQSKYMVLKPFSIELQVNCIF